MPYNVCHTLISILLSLRGYVEVCNNYFEPNIKWTEFFAYYKENKMKE